MSSAHEPEHPYTVHYSAVIVDALRRLQRRATREGRGEEFLAAVRYAIEQLCDRPNEFGEPLYRLPALRMQIRSAVVRPLALVFGVSQDQPLVFIKGVKLLSRPEK